jgi:hypothetical protein
VAVVVVETAAVAAAADTNLLYAICMSIRGTARGTARQSNCRLSIDDSLSNQDWHLQDI